ncbi:VOC family protein [Solwaraspora sp. WMMD406]|uniref:VOC family protein n=1 Tax=Solwaraspora sp. WMMD406 TaxID=3016095 RepID=UPI002416ACED|nr:VOC family protein [Solwaraspora sp. WMMD406]MDG4767977.1 VOC family protein [Solwaraspora sp. WMMD406]
MHTVLDATDVRSLAEFYRVFLGLRYRPGDEPRATESRRMSTGSCWSTATATAGSRSNRLERHRRRAEQLGASLLYDRTDDAEEPLYVLADPAGHPFCILVGRQ